MYTYMFQWYNDVLFHYTDRDKFERNEFKDDFRPKLVNLNQFNFAKVASRFDSNVSFRKYLDQVFTYAGTISMHRETEAVSDNASIKTGGFVVSIGSPEHLVIIVGSARKQAGDIMYLLAERYMPTQSIHVLTNTIESNINP